MRFIIYCLITLFYFNYSNASILQCKLHANVITTNRFTECFIKILFLLLPSIIFSVCKKITRKMFMILLAVLYSKYARRWFMLITIGTQQCLFVVLSKFKSIRTCRTRRSLEMQVVKFLRIFTAEHIISFEAIHPLRHLISKTETRKTRTCGSTYLLYIPAVVVDKRPSKPLLTFPDHWVT